MTSVRRRTAVAVGGVLLTLSATLITVLVALDDSSNGQTGVLIGTLSSDRLLGLGVLGGLTALAIGLSLIPVRGWSLGLLVAARIVAWGSVLCGGFLWVFTTGTTVTPLTAAGCETGYVVEERSFLLLGAGTVYRQDGLLVTTVATTMGDDGYHPFFTGAYEVEVSEAGYNVWYNIGATNDRQSVSMTGEPAFTLPMLPQHECAVSPLPRPTPSPSATPPAAEQDGPGVTEMLAMSLDASVGPVTNESGTALEVTSIPLVTQDCEGGGTRSAVAVAFHTADNESSLERILLEWDRAGYLADRAMQEDLRYSETLPVERMSIRDTSTIDGLIHLQITGRCAP